jgi:hypothetical protein
MNAVALSSADLPAMQAAAMTGFNAVGGTLSSNMEWFLDIAVFFLLALLFWGLTRSFIDWGAWFKSSFVTREAPMKHRPAGWSTYTKKQRKLKGWNF